MSVRAPPACALTKSFRTVRAQRRGTLLVSGSLGNALDRERLGSAKLIAIELVNDAGADEETGDVQDDLESLSTYRGREAGLHADNG